MSDPQGAPRSAFRADVVIVGTGFSGLGMAIALKRAGREDFILLERADAIGGTWRDNTYPGCACDIPAHLYSFAADPHAGWTSMWAGHQAILGYLQALVARYDLMPHIRFGVAAHGGEWDEEDGRWHLRTEQGDEYVSRFLVLGIGALQVPNVPRFRGAERFAGTTFHTSRWDADDDLGGKKVAIIGTGASAVQVIPELVDVVDELHVYQRTPAWVLPKRDISLPPLLRRIFRRIPLVRKAFRSLIYWTLETVSIGLNHRPGFLRPLEKLARRHIATGIDDPGLRRRLTPDYRMGCKRILGSSTYYPALNRPNVTVVTEGIDEITERAIVTSDGVERPVDAIIYATGFHPAAGFQRMNLAGRDGRRLLEVWKERGAQTHLGITISGFPNAFFLMGPNTGLGHNSIVFMLEQQIRYVLQAMELVDESGATALDVRQEAQDRYNVEIQRKLASSVWSTGGCTSWYLDRGGVNRALWPGSSWQYRRRTRTLDPAEFDLRVAPSR